MFNKKAYTIIETLVMVLLLPLVLSLTFTLVRLISLFDYGLNTRQNFIGILQLRKRVAVGSDIVIKDDSLQMTYDNHYVELLCQHDVLNEVDGYMEYLIEIEACEWVIKDQMIYISYVYKENDYEIFIGYLK